MSDSVGISRLSKEFKKISLRKDLHNFVAVPSSKNIYEWHFIIFGLKDCDYVDGFYHGKISFPPEYPHKPQSLMMFTPSGRFKTNTKICTSFSDFHPETWNPLWGVETICIGLISFMCSEENTTGSQIEPSHSRR